MKNQMKFLSRNFLSKQTKICKISFPKKNFATSSNNNEQQEIKIEFRDKEVFFPIKEIPKFSNGYFTVFEYTEEPVKSDENGSFQRLPQVPYEIKEHALKGTLYSFFLTFLGRFSGGLKLAPITIVNFKIFPHFVASVVGYHILKPLWFMYNSVTKVSLTQDGHKVVFEFKNGLQKPLEVEISKISKKKLENFLNECYTEPFLFPLEVDFTDKRGIYSLFNRRTYYLYGDSHCCIKHGEILRAIINGQSIKLA